MPQIYNMGPPASLPLRRKACWGFIKVFYLATDAQVGCLKNNFKIYIKIDIKTAPTCFGAITVIREHIIRIREDGVTAPKHVGAVLM
jgi:hypothetical protein